MVLKSPLVHTVSAIFLVSMMTACQTTDPTDVLDKNDEETETPVNNPSDEGGEDNSNEDDSNKENEDKNEDKDTDDKDAAAPPSISIATASINEGNSGTKKLTFTISLDTPADREVSVTYTTEDKTASAGSDYEARNGTVTIPGGDTSATVDITIMGDTDVENDETFNLVLSEPVNAKLGTATATGSILNDDAVNASVGGSYSCVHSGSGTDYPVGPGQSYTSVSDVPWSELGAGDTVRIHYRAEPYREKIIISTDGTKQNPIRVCGVAGPNGERPILDGNGAVNDPDDSGAYGTYRPMEGLAMVLLWNRDYDLKVHNVVIEGLHIRNAKNNFSYTRTDGSKDKYEGGSACIRVQAADNVVIRNNELENCGNGIFTMSQDYNEASLTRNILIEGNYLHGNGQPGSYREHGVYIQAIGATYQYNRFGPNAPGADGVTLKERVAGSVIRYNWFDSGSARFLDLVEVEDAAPWYIEEEYRKWAADNGEAIDPDRLAKVRAAEAGYRKTYVYGNFFNHVGSQTDSGNIVHYGSDNDPALSRAGTLYFYNNTVSIQENLSDSWRFRLFYLGNRDASTRAKEVVEMFNNIVYFTGEGGGTPAHFCLNEINGGTINFGKNWMTNSWNKPDVVNECYYGNPSDAPTLNGVGNLLDTAGAPAPVDIRTLVPKDITTIRNQAQPLPQTVASKQPVARQYEPHLNSKRRSVISIPGAMELP